MRAEQDILNEILRKNAQGYVDYAETAAMERVQAILQGLIDDSWEYVPKVVNKPFEANLSRTGYSNAKALMSTQTIVVEQLIQNLMGEIIDSTNVAFNSAQNLYQIARLGNDIYRQTAIASTMYTEALGKGAFYSGQTMEAAIRNHGITGFVDARGRQWSLTDYCSMATRTTAHQAEVSAVLTRDDHDLYQIVKIGSTCPICAPLEGRVYSKSGMNPNYPPLSLAFGKIDPNGGNDLSNTYLCIHPSCYHSLIRYTEAGKTDKQIQKMRDFSNPETNPLDVDPRSKKQIEAYQTKERNRAQLRNDIKQMHDYRGVLGSQVPKDITRFRKLKYEQPDKWAEIKSEYRKTLNAMNKASIKPDVANKIPQISFTPSATIEDAQAYAGKYFKTFMPGKTFKGEAAYKGISLDNANEINKALTNVYTMFPKMDKLSGIKVISPTSAQGKKVFTSADAVFAYNPAENGIFVNKDLLKSADAINAYFEKSKEAFNYVMQNIEALKGSQKELALRYKTAGRDTVGQNVEDLFIHELGHHAEWTLLDAKSNNLFGSRLSEYAPKISGYASANKHEYLAESFTAYMKGERGILDPEFVKFLDDKLAP